jgi:hypothetical protein
MTGSRIYAAFFLLLPTSCCRVFCRLVAIIAYYLLWINTIILIVTEIAFIKHDPFINKKTGGTV